jgi:hypothetical protein
MRKTDLVRRLGGIFRATRYTGLPSKIRSVFATLI